MSKLSSTFATMVRETVRGFKHFCGQCNRVTWWIFTAEAGRYEYYECTECKNTAGFVVR